MDIRQWVVPVSTEPVSPSDSNESCDTIDTRSMCTVQEAVVQEFETEYNSNDISLYLDKDLTDED